MPSSYAVPVIRALGFAAIVSGTAVSVPVIAENSLAIEEIIVTARKKEESVQDVPIAMTALAKELQDSTIRDLADIEGYAPNVVFNDGAAGGGGAGTRVIIRGVAGSAIGEKSFDNPIAVSLDGIFFNSDSGRIVQNFDVERVEVLRGPQGTLFGRNTVGGVINVIRSKPTGEIGGKLRVTAGDFGQEEVRGLLNFPVTDTLAAKVYYASVKADGPLDRTFDGGHAPVTDYENFGIQLLWEPTDKFDALLSLDRYNNQSDGGAPTNWNNAGGVIDGIPFTFPCLVFGDCAGNEKTRGDVGTSVDANQRNEGDYRNDVISLTMKYQINDNLTLISTTGNHDTPYEDEISELDGSALDFIFIDNRNEYEQFSTELRLEGGYERFDFVVGAYYLDSEYNQDWATVGSFWSIVIPPAAGDLANSPADAATCASNAIPGNDTLWCDVSFAPGGAHFGEALGVGFDQRLFQTQKTESLSFFGQIDYSVTDKLILTGGVRYTNDEKDFTGFQAYQGAARYRYPFNFDVPRIDLSNDWSETTIKLAFAYHMTDDVMFFGSYAEGFKSGGFYGVNQNIRDFDRNQYDPETAESWEVGMKSQWMDNRVQLNVSVFLNDFADKQDSNAVRDEDTNTVATVWENQSSVQYWGVEVESRFVATERFNMFATVGFLDSEYDDFFSLGAIPADDPCNVTDTCVPIDSTGFTPKYAPEWTFGLGGTYTLPLGPGELSLHMKYNYVDEQETDTFNDDGTAIVETEFVSAQISYSWNDMRITAFGENMLDEQFEVIGCLSVLFCTGGIQPGEKYGIEFEMLFGGNRR
jgi:iron complex outermembrane receptor protein